MLDDRHDLGSLPKFGFQIVAAWLLVKLGGVTLTHLGELVDFDRVALGAIALPFTVFAIVGVMNAVNFSDGMDGLAGGFALAATFWFGVAAVAGGYTLEFQVACTLAGLLVAFLLFNARLPHRGKALVFMGDAGSYFLGLVLAWLAIRLAMNERPALAPMTAVWILGIPLADTVVLMVRRALTGRNPFRADHGHVHHLLLRRLSHGRACALLFALSFAMGGIGYVAGRAGAPEFAMFYLYGALWIAYYVASSFVFGASRPR
jgi:UDP-GlcNAc:undecaprenyl-phosphate GlcNAc-1-phosphate transferase